jgi:hypothetical protein
MYMGREQNETEKRRRIILEGIRENLSFTDIASQLGIKRSDLLREVNNMRRASDPEFRDAQRLGQTKLDEDKQRTSKKHEEKFYDMTGMTLREKSFLNMLNFYKPEILTILRSDDPESAIRKLSSSTRRSLIHNGILERYKSEITQQAIDQLT